MHICTHTSVNCSRTWKRRLMFGLCWRCQNDVCPPRCLIHVKRMSKRHADLSSWFGSRPWPPLTSFWHHCDIIWTSHDIRFDSAACHHFCLPKPPTIHVKASLTCLDMAWHGLTWLNSDVKTYVKPCQSMSNWCQGMYPAWHVCHRQQISTFDRIFYHVK